MISRNSFPGNTIVVAKSDTGDYKTIGEAIKNAEPETRILVKPGIYRESLVIDKTLEILGDGQVSDIVIESTDASCILMQTEQAIVRGLSVRGCTRNNRDEYFAVNISQGKLILEDCDITSDSCCVLIKGFKANPLIRRCRIHDGKGGGIGITENGLGTIEDCNIYSNYYPGVVINGSNPTIRRCQIHDGKDNGILIIENGLGIIEDCDIYSNYCSEVLINNSNPTLHRCHIHDGKQEGISIQKLGQGTIEDCRIERHPSPGIKIERRCHPVFRRCTLKTNKPSYLGLAIILGLSMALSVAVALGWVIPSIMVVVLIAIAIIAYRLLKKGFSEPFIFLAIYPTMVLGFKSGIAFVFGFNLYILLELLGIGGIVAISIFYPAFEQAKLMSKYHLTKPTRKKFIE